MSNVAGTLLDVGGCTETCYPCQSVPSCKCRPIGGTSTDVSRMAITVTGSVWGQGWFECPYASGQYYQPPNMFRTRWDEPSYDPPWPPLDGNIVWPNYWGNFTEHSPVGTWSVEAKFSDDCKNRKTWIGPQFLVSRVSSNFGIAGQPFNVDYLIVDVPVDSWFVDVTVNLPVLYSYSSFKFLSSTSVPQDHDLWTFEDGIQERIIELFPLGMQPPNIGQYNNPKKYTVPSWSSIFAFIDTNITEFHCDSGNFYKQNACWNPAASPSLTLGGLTFTAAVV